jgi:DNA polymerase
VSILARDVSCFSSGPFVGLPRRHFRIGLVDPPWNVHAWSPRGESKSPSRHYPCQDLDTLKALPVGELMAPDSALFCWVVQPMLPGAIEVLAAWGFEFRTVAFVWIKMPASWSEQQLPLRIRPRMGLGYHTRSGCEQCWLAIRGRGYERQSKDIDQVVYAPVREHSRKPEVVAESIERLVGDVPRIELFAREQRAGWSAWGNEVGKFTPSSADPHSQVVETPDVVRRLQGAEGSDNVTTLKPPLQVAARAIDPRDPTARRVLHQDFETRSRVDLRKVGAHRYAADPSTEVLCCAYAVDDDPVQLWLPGNPVPAEFVEAARNSDWVVVAHNDSFEATIERHIMAPRHGWPLIPSEQRECSQAMCLAAGLPARLSTAADALELCNRKDAAGERLMHQTSKPRRAHKDEDPAGTYWFDDVERLRRLYDYCRQDVEVERELYGRLPPLSPAEQALRGLSGRINTRGFHIDRGFAEAARRIAKSAAPEIDAELIEITDGAVTGINQVARLLEWLQHRGYAGESLNRKAIARQLEKEDLAVQLRRVLELRLGGAQAAVKKIDALLARAGDDNRIRGAFRFHGASTGRWAGEGFQPQNLKKPTTEDLDAAIAAVATGDYAHVKKLYPRPLSVVGDCSRSMICAAPGHMLVGADFSAIESRVLAWAAGEEWKLDSYRRFDATHDPRDEPYCETACKIFRVPSGTYTKESPERSVGKTCDLAFGYMGGLGAWRKFETARFTDAEVETFKQEWRAAHPKIKAFWYALDHAAWSAVRERGRIFRCGSVAFRCDATFLQLKLPNGRKLSYPRPRIIGDDREQRVVFADNSAGQFKDCRHGQGAYGGTWTENVVQAIARDLLAEAMLRVEAAGYPIVLHVHDEIACEVPIGFGSTDEFTRLMTRKPAWALELPIAAEAWSGPRYMK